MTCGDHLGIGPEIALGVSQNRDLVPNHSLQIFGLPEKQTQQASRPTSKNTGLTSLRQAAKSCLEHTNAALVTGPVCKYRLRKIGFNYPGQTEFLAHACGLPPDHVTMAMIGKKLRIFLVTTHLPLARAVTSITKFALARTLFHAHHTTRILLNKTPRIAVAALNPHAGEGGLFGNEEKKFLEPILKKTSALLDIQPPHLMPADSLFYSAVVEKKFDAIICLYHDQGLIPFKMLHFHNGVNLTVGLPFVRTAPDHGTAFDIAGKGLARTESTLAAIRLAARLLPHWHTLPDLPTSLKKCKPCS